MQNLPATDLAEEEKLEKQKVLNSLSNFNANIGLLNDSDDDDDVDYALASPSLNDIANQSPNLLTNIKSSIDVIRSILDVQKKLFERLSHNDKVLKDFVESSNTLTVIEQQYVELLMLLEPGSPNKMKLDDRLIKAKTASDLCAPILEVCVEFLLTNLLNELRTCVGKLSIHNPIRQPDANDLKILSAKLKTVKEYFPQAAVYDKRDIFAIRKTEPHWKELYEYAEFRELGSAKKLKKSFGNMVRQVHVTNAMIDMGSDKRDSQFYRQVAIGFGAVYYFIMASEAERRTQIVYANPNAENVVEMWNLMDNKLIKKLIKITLPGITEKKKIHVTRQYPQITFEKLKEEIADGTIEKITPEKKPNRKDSRGITKKAADRIPIRILSAKKLPPILEIESIEEETVFSPLKKHGKLRTQMIEEHIEKQKTDFFGMFKNIGCLGRDIGNPDAIDPHFDGIVIHFHGGGFIAMSSGSHQSYTRQWANILKKTVFSVDYRLAPTHPFPAAVDDCWQAYNWILDNSLNALGISPSKVILVGDSAGGNLALAVTYRAIKLGYRVPDGLVLAYPAMNVNDKSFTPSLLLSIDDQIVPYSLLKFCADAYIPEGAQPEKNPYLSPVYVNDELLSCLPPIRIVIGTRDPLHDESWRFLNKLKKLKKDAKLIVYQHMPHGFLSYDVPNGMAESKLCIAETAAIIKDLMDRVPTFE
jgi:hormone-sensitive lipase